MTVNAEWKIQECESLSRWKEGSGIPEDMAADEVKSNGGEVSLERNKGKSQAFSLLLPYFEYSTIFGSFTS